MQQRITQKLRILRFVAEQTIVSAQEINRYFFTDDRTNLVVSTLYQLGLARMKFGLVPGSLWYIDDPQCRQSF